MDRLNNASADASADWACLLPREVFGEVILILRAGLPPPELDEPEVWAGRDRVAMAAVASLAPATAAEGRLAAQFVAADAYGMDCFRLAQVSRREPDVARKCAAQAMAMMRESKSALGMLLRVQAVRRKVAESELAAKQADWVERAAMDLMAEAMGIKVAVGDAPEVVRKTGQTFYSENERRKIRRETRVGFEECVRPPSGPLPQGAGDTFELIAERDGF